MQPQVALKWLFSFNSRAVRVVFPLTGQRHAQPLLRRRIRKEKRLLLANSQCDSRCVVLCVVRRERNVVTCCSRPATGAVLAHPVAATRPFAGIECAYSARVAGDFIWCHPARFDSTGRCLSPRERLALLCHNTDRSYIALVQQDLFGRKLSHPIR